MIKIKIRRFKKTDAEEVAKLIAYTLRTTNIKDYSTYYIENLIDSTNPRTLIEKANHSHFYVLIDDEQIKACGAIGPYGENLEESYFFSIFVRSEYQGLGLGKKIIETLENDEYFIRSKRIEVPASITALDFYLKLGYKFKNNIKKIDESGLIRLEKFNS